MRVFVWEYITGGGLSGNDAPRALIAEARMMVRALAADLAQIRGVRVLVARDSSLSLGPMPAEVAMIEPEAAWQAWRRTVAASDLVWPIAPETDGVLERCTALAEAEGRPVIGSRASALAVARSKFATARHLAARGVVVVPTVLAGEAPPPAEHGWVVKPDDGAGCADTHILPDPRQIARWQSRAGARAFVAQPFVPGPALSLSMLAQDGAAWLLACNCQRIERDGGQLRYRGGIVGGAEARRPQLEPIAAAVAAALPGLSGHVGVDLVDGPDGPVVLEVNPRLTMSYVGLGRSIGVNPAGLALDLRHKRLADIVGPLAPRPVAVAVPRLEAAA